MLAHVPLWSCVFLRRLYHRCCCCRLCHRRLRRLSLIATAMDEMQTKIDDLKETMPSDTYLQLCQETKRVHESQTHEPLFEIKYTVNTFISSHYYDNDTYEN